MNAKEFAHELEKAASFIRQQQAEIEALKAETVIEILEYFKDCRYELDADFVFKLKKHFQICGEEE